MDLLFLSGRKSIKVDHIGTASVRIFICYFCRQVSERGAVEVETGERSGAWRNIMSFAKEFANIWRKW